MKLIDAIKRGGNPYYIPNCSRDDLPDFFKELGFTTGVEVGVFMGDNLEKYCKAGFTMYGIDSWSNSSYYSAENCLKPSRFYKSADDIYNLAVKKTSSYPNCTLIKKTSVSALKDIEWRSLDFVYIDGNHKYGAVAMDLSLWSSRVKKGGIIAGHDYYSRIGKRRNRGVKYAVEGFVKTYDINNWYVLGRKRPHRGEICDKELSFMFFKHW